MTSCSLNSSTKYRLEDVRAFIFHNLDMLQDPSKWPVKHAVLQLASQEADTVFGENADCDKAAGDSRFIALINKREKHLCRSIHRAQSEVLAVCYSPDGSKVARAEGSEVVVCDASTGFVQKTLSGHSRYVTAVSYSCLYSNVWCVLTIERFTGLSTVFVSARMVNTWPVAATTTA
jgi:WD40 repeat protein